MKKQNKKKKIVNRIFKTLIFFVFLTFLINFINTNIIFKPFIQYKGDNNLHVLGKNWINANFKTPFITKKSILMINPNSINSKISTINLQRNFFLVWSISMKQKISNRYIFLNNEMRVLDENSNLIDIPIQQDDIKKQIPYILKIEILEKVPIKKNNELKDNTNTIIKEQREVIHQTEIDFYSIYQSEIKGFVEYLYKSESSMGPKISLIQFFPKEGLRFFLYENIYWIGNINNYALLEKNINKCEAYLKKKNKNQSYHEFDLRYENRIICRNNQ